MFKVHKSKIFSCLFIFIFSSISTLPLFLLYSKNTVIEKSKSTYYNVSRNAKIPSLISNKLNFKNFIINGIPKDSYSIDFQYDSSYQQSLINYMNQYPNLFVNNPLSVSDGVSYFKNFTFNAISNTVVVKFDFLVSNNEGTLEYSPGTITFENFNAENTMVNDNITDTSPYFLSNVGTIDITNISTYESVEILRNDIFKNLSGIFKNYSRTFLNPDYQNIKIIKAEQIGNSNTILVTFSVENASYNLGYQTHEYEVPFSGFKIASTPKLISSISVNKLNIVELNNVTPTMIITNINLQNLIINKMNTAPELFIQNYINTPIYSQFKNINFFINNNNSVLVSCYYLSDINGFSPIYSRGEFNITNLWNYSDSGNSNIGDEIVPSNNDSSGLAIDSSTLWLIICSVIIGILLIALLIVWFKYINKKKRDSSRRGCGEYFGDCYDGY